MDKVFAVVVTYNGMKWLDRCLGSLEESDVPISTIVVDNASTDGTPDYIAKHFHKIHLIRSEENLGFAKANNIGIRYALDNGAEYVFLLNQDAWVEKGAIEQMIRTFEFNKKIGVVSPMHMNGAGDALDWKFATNMSGDFISDCYLNKLKEYYDVPYVNAAAWMVSKECLSIIGGFDTNLFIHYGEDIDFTHRLAYWKFLLVINTKSRIYHDREFRKGIDEEYKQRIFKRDKEVHRSKLELGNINYDIDIDKLIRSEKRAHLVKLLKFNLSEANKKASMIQLLEKIKHSRSLNKSGRSPWLDD